MVMNMKKTNSIRFLCVILLLLLCFVVYLSSRIKKDPQLPSEQEEILIAEETEEEETSEEIVVETSSLPSDALFILRDEDGYLTVYLIATDTVYMYTDILTELLPEHLKKEIAEGKTFASPEELYGFLESYSS